jgi:hypothetical protein
LETVLRSNLLWTKFSSTGNGERELRIDREDGLVRRSLLNSMEDYRPIQGGKGTNAEAEKTF